jgi:hypothetical protein
MRQAEAAFPGTVRVTYAQKWMYGALVKLGESDAASRPRGGPARREG